MHAELVAACDIVIGKLGHGLCSEIIACHRPILYTPRDDFIESKVLEATTQKHVGGARVSLDAFFNERLDNFLQIAMDSHLDKEIPPLNGAAIVADKIAAF